MEPAVPAGGKRAGGDRRIPSPFTTFAAGGGGDNGVPSLKPMGGWVGEELGEGNALGTHRELLRRWAPTADSIRRPQWSRAVCTLEKDVWASAVMRAVLRP
jgi:hypothetical protein